MSSSCGISSPHSISSVIATSNFFLALSYIAMLVDARNDRVFACWTNLCYIAVGFECLTAAYLRSETAVLAIGLFGAIPFIYVMLGAASLSFHATGRMGSPVHAFDILLAEILVTHVTFVICAVDSYWLFRKCWPRFLHAIVLTWSLVFLLAVALLVSCYDAIYPHKQTTFFGLGPASAVLYESTCPFEPDSSPHRDRCRGSQESSSRPSCS